MVHFWEGVIVVTVLVILSGANNQCLSQGGSNDDCSEGYGVACQLYCGCSSVVRTK